MHTLALVVGDNLHDQLGRFSSNLEVEPHEIQLSNNEIESMAAHYAISRDDLAILVTKLADYFGDDGFLRDGKLFRISTTNPRGHFDSYEVGGQWRGFLKLCEPRPIRRFFGLFGAGETMQATSARKVEIDRQALLDDPPMVLVFQGEWFESTIFAEGDAVERRKIEFAQFFAEIPDDAMLTVVDVHR